MLDRWAPGKGTQPDRRMWGGGGMLKVGSAGRMGRAAVGDRAGGG